MKVRRRGGGRNKGDGDMKFASKFTLGPPERAPSLYTAIAGVGKRRTQQKKLPCSSTTPIWLDSMAQCGGRSSHRTIADFKPAVAQDGANVQKTACRRLAV